MLSLWSKCIPRYFVTAAIGISMLLIVTGGHRPFLSVNVMWNDFVSFIFILHFLSQSWVRFKWSCKYCAAARGSVRVAMMTVSSAKVMFCIKLSDPVTGPVWSRGWVEVFLYSSMTAALEGGEWSAARPGRTLPLGKTRYPV